MKTKISYKPEISRKLKKSCKPNALCKPETSHKPKTLCKRISHIKKISSALRISCLLFAGCTLFLSCGQASSGENNFSMSESTKNPIPDPTQDITKTPTSTPTQDATMKSGETPSLSADLADSTNPPSLLPTPTAEPFQTSTPAPTQIPCITGLPYWKDTVYSTVEKDGETQTRLAQFKISEDLLRSLSYREDQYPQLYARYQGRFRGNSSRRYIIDFIQVEDFRFPSEHPVILCIRIYNRYDDINDDNLVQTIEMPIDSYSLDAPQCVVLTDLNGDQNDDFIIDLGISTTGRSSYSLFFVYDSETGQYKLLDGFVNATFYEEEMLIYESNQNGSFHYFNKYSVEGISLILQESIWGDGYFYGTGEMAYTLKKRVDGELVTVKDCVPEDQIDFSSWHPENWDYRVK